MLLEEYSGSDSASKAFDVSGVACNTAYFVNIHHINEVGNGYQWENWGMKGEWGKATNWQWL